MMTNTTPEALIGAVVEEVDAEGECINKVRLRQPDGRYVELYACCEDEDEVGYWIEVL